MTKAFEDINYSLRPAKNVQRKMLVDVCQRLPHIRPDKEYRYIGFGSPYFSDIKLIHRRLGIQDIVSIEREEDEKERFELNKPFRCVDLKWGKSSSVLPTLSWEKPTILWLDYTEQLKTYILSDIREFMTNAPVGSMLIVTVNAHPTPIHALSEEEGMLDELRENLSREVIPQDVGEKELRGWGYADTCRRIVNNMINEEFLDHRNSGVSEEEQIEYRQLVNFRHQDNAKMMTVGGVLYSDDLDPNYEKASFDDLFFVREGKEAYKIDTPVLTYPEMRQLDKKLPKDPESMMTQQRGTGKIESKLPNKHIKRYAELYRYFPTFVESEL